MASHRLAEILRSTGQLSEDDIENMDENGAWQWLRTYTSLPLQVDGESCDDTDC